MSSHPIKINTNLMIISLVEGIVDLLNYFPSKGVVSGVMITSTIVEGTPNIYF